MRILNTKLFLFICIALGGIAGCDVSVTVDGKDDQSEAPPAAPAEPAGEEGGDGFSLQIPSLGVDVQTDSQGGVDVKAPGTGVRVKDGKVDVEAPGTSVNVE